MIDPARAGAAIRLLCSVPLRVCLGGKRVEFVGWGFHPPEPWRNYWHSHSFFELCYAYAGSGVFRTWETEYPVESGDLFLARPGDVHEIVADSDDPLGIVFWSWTMVPERSTERMAAGPPRADGPSGSGESAHLLNGFATGSRQVAPVAGTALPRLLRELVEEAAAPGPGTDDLLTVLGSALVLNCARALADRPTSVARTLARPDGHAAALVATMARYLEDNFDRPVSVRNVAAQVHLSDRHAARLFQHTSGLTIMAYLASYRLGVAAQRLADPTLRSTSVAAIARSCGYPDARHFSASFRKHWGVLPTEIRARNGTTHLSGPSG